MRSSRLLSTAHTWAHQASVPPLPVPPLEATLAKWLRSVQPLVTPAEFAKTTKAAQEFLAGPGPALQAQLLQHAAGKRNWLEEWWDGGVYLDPSLSLPINYNYFLRLTDEPVPADKAPWAHLARAARLMHAACKFRDYLDAGAVPPDMDKDRPLCMSQYARLYGHARIAGEHTDSMRTYGWEPTGPDGQSAVPDAAHYRTEFIPLRSRGEEHFAVVCRGRWYKLPARDASSGKPLPAQALAEGLIAIHAAASRAGEEPHPVGALTAGDRRVWGRARAALAAASLTNAETLDAIDSAAWVVALDDFTWTGDLAAATGAAAASPTSTASAAYSPASALLTAESPRYLVGRGDGGDRWFDKHQLIITRNCGAGLLLEHAQGDGTPPLRLINYMAAASASVAGGAASDEAASSAVGGVPLPPLSGLVTSDLMLSLVWERFTGSGPSSPAPSDRPVLCAASSSAASGLNTSPSAPIPVKSKAGLVVVTPLPWEVPPSLTHAIREAAAFAASQAAALTTSTLKYHKLGARGIKGFKLPPDAFVQMGFQAAHAALHGQPAPTYESTSTRLFSHGRTETTRSCSLESQALVGALGLGRDAAFCGGGPSLRRRHLLAGLLAGATAAHSAYASSAKAGAGVDRHLTGLRNLALAAAAQGGPQLPALFTDPSYALSRHWRMSTSNCGSSATSIFGFGPVVADGYGLAYFITDDAVTVNITGWTGAGAAGNEAGLPYPSPGPTSPPAFREALEAALDRLALVGQDHAAGV